MSYIRGEYYVYSNRTETVFMCPNLVGSIPLEVLDRIVEERLREIAFFASMEQTV